MSNSKAETVRSDSHTLPIVPRSTLRILLPSLSLAHLVSLCSHLGAIVAAYRVAYISYPLLPYRYEWVLTFVARYLIPPPGVITVTAIALDERQ